MPIGEELISAIERGVVDPRDDVKARARILADEFGWDVSDARRLWCFAPDATGPNLLVDVTKGVQYLHEIKDSCVSAFQWATKEGVTCEENMRGVRVNILDVTVSFCLLSFRDPLHISISADFRRYPSRWRTNYTHYASCHIRRLPPCHPCTSRTYLPRFVFTNFFKLIRDLIILHTT